MSGHTAALALALCVDGPSVSGGRVLPVPSLLVPQSPPPPPLPPAGCSGGGLAWGWGVPLGSVPSECVFGRTPWLTNGGK